MAVPVIPKSEARKSSAIIHGYGQVPSVEVDGRTAWALPGGGITVSRELAEKAAKKIDKTIQTNMNRSGRRLLPQ